MKDVESVKAHILTTAPEDLDTAGVPLQLWTRAMDDLLLTVTGHERDAAVLHLAEAFPDSDYFQFMAQVVRQTRDLPPARPFRDDLAADVQWVPRPGSDRALLLVCGHAQRLGIQVSLLHRWMAQQDAHLIYVRDLSRRYFTNGIQSLGDYGATITALRGQFDAVGIRRLVTYGNSAGVYGALKLGIDLDADAITAIAGPTNLDPLFLDTRIIDTPIDRLIPDHFDKAIDLSGDLIRSRAQPKVAIWFGADNRNDRLHAENISTYAEAGLIAVDGYGKHDLFRELVMRRRYGEVLDWIAARLTEP